MDVKTEKPWLKLQPGLLDEVDQKSSLENVSTFMTAVLSV